VVIEHDHLLPKLYGRVLIPPAVAEELNHESTPKVVRVWLAGPPSWLEIRRAVGTLRVLADGAIRGFTNLEEAFERQTNFR
jgi:predicted nucleic acid-binding protein